MLIKNNLIFEGIFYIFTSVSTPESVPFKNVLTQENHCTAQKLKQTHFCKRRLIYVMVRSHECVFAHAWFQYPVQAAVQICKSTADVENC